MMIPKVLGVCAASVLAFAQFGCASSNSGTARLDSTTSSMASVESLIQDGQEELNALMINLDSMEESQDASVNFRAFERNVRNLERIADRVRAERVALEAGAAAHVSQWRAESMQLSGDRAQRISDDRRADFEEAVQDVSEELDDLRAAYDPFLARVKDLQVVLSNDLTRRGIESTRPVRGNLMEAAADLRDASEDAREAIQAARNEFSR